MPSLGPFQTDWVRYHPKPADITNSLRKYFHPTRPRLNNEAYAEAIRRTREDYRLGFKVHPYHVNDVIRCYQHPERSPGLPHTTNGIRHKRDVPVSYIKSFVHNLKYGKYRKCTTPCNAVGKSMVGKQPKYRLIWVYPCHMTMAEGVFAMPLIQAYKSQRKSYAIWLQYSKGGMKYLCSLRKKHAKWLGLDWSAYDSTIPPWLIRDAFGILREQFDFSQYNDWGKPTDPHTLPRLWDRIVEYFINTPVKFPDGHIEVKHMGIPSGSWFTNILGSTTNSIMKHYLLIMEQIAYSRKNNLELGDDGVVEIFAKHLCLKQFAQRAEKDFGTILNVEKTEFGDYVSFLGYSMGSGAQKGIPLANYDKLVAQLLLPSRPDRSIGDLATRIKALQLSCFGVGNLRFLHESTGLLTRLGIAEPALPHKRSEEYSKLEYLGLSDWPPLSQVITAVT